MGVQADLCQTWLEILRNVFFCVAAHMQTVAQYNCQFNIFQKLHFSKSHFFERPQEKCYHVMILHSKSLKKCHKNLKISQQINILYQKIILNRAFSIVKLSAREVTIFPGKICIRNFSFKMLQTKTKLYCMHS